MWLYFGWRILYSHSRAMAITQTWAPAGGRPCQPEQSLSPIPDSRKFEEITFRGQGLTTSFTSNTLIFITPLCLSPWTSLHYLFLHLLLLHFFLRQHSCFSTCFSSTTSITFLISSAAKDGTFLCHHLFSQTTTQIIAWDLYSTVNYISVGHSSPTGVWLWRVLLPESRSLTSTKSSREKWGITSDDWQDGLAWKLPHPCLLNLRRGHSVKMLKKSFVKCFKLYLSSTFRGSNCPPSKFFKCKTQDHLHKNYSEGTCYKLGLQALSGKTKLRSRYKASYMHFHMLLGVFCDSQSLKTSGIWRYFKMLQYSPGYSSFLKSQWTFGKEKSSSILNPSHSHILLFSLPPYQQGQ